MTNYIDYPFAVALTVLCIVVATFVISFVFYD
jgi:hypothetical protein